MTANRAAGDTSIAGLDARLSAGKFDIQELGLALDQSSSSERLAQVLSLEKPAQAQLYEAAKGARKLRLEQLVPPEVPDLCEVVHHGKNTLGMFTRFAKVFCRPKREARELWGYNRAGAMIETGIGPGYYVAYEGPGDEVLIDYTRLPAGKPEHWPEIKSNKSRLSRFVYADMIDALRAVSDHVSVGRAIRNGKVLDNWFVLCRG